MGRRELSIQLRHTHLPKLASHGVVDYNQEAETVSYQPDEQVEVVLDASRRKSRTRTPERGWVLSLFPAVISPDALRSDRWVVVDMPGPPSGVGNGTQ